MTCILGIADGTNVWIGGDRACSDGSTVLSLHRPKIARVGEYIIGFAGSLGIGQLAHMVDVPASPKNLEKALRTTFIKSLKSAIEEYGNANANEDNSTDWLIGTQGRLFEISSDDWQVSEYEYSAIGSGANIALGSLHTSRTWKDNHKRVSVALDAAITLSPTCQGPMDILKI